LFEFIYKSSFVEIRGTLVGDKFRTDKMLLCLQKGRDKMAELKRMICHAGKFIIYTVLY